MVGGDINHGGNKHATPTALVFEAIFISIDITCLRHLRDISCLRHLTPMGFMMAMALFFLKLMALHFGVCQRVCWFQSLRFDSAQRPASSECHDWCPHVRHGWCPHQPWRQKVYARTCLFEDELSIDGW